MNRGAQWDGIKRPGFDSPGLLAQGRVTPDKSLNCWEPQGPVVRVAENLPPPGAIVAKQGKEYDLIISSPS